MVNLTRIGKNPSTRVISFLFTLLCSLAVDARAQLSGNYDIGLRSQTPFQTLTTAVNYLKTVGCITPVTFTLVDSAYPNEVFPIDITSAIRAPYLGGTWKFTIAVRSDSVVSLSGSSATALILIWTNDVVIDGGLGGERRLRLKNTGGGAGVLIENDGAGNNIIRNCIIEGAVGVKLSGPGHTTITQNLIQRSGIGISTSFLATASITRNRIWSVGTGIDLGAFDIDSVLQRTLVANNQISSDYSNSTGIRCSNGRYDIFHNTIYINNSSAGLEEEHPAPLVLTAGRGHRVMNNIFYRTFVQSPPISSNCVTFKGPFPICYSGTLDPSVFRNNVYFSVRDTNRFYSIFWSTGIPCRLPVAYRYYGFREWRSRVFDNYSYFANSPPPSVIFADASSGNLDLVGYGQLCGAGVFVGITEDFNGNTRSASTPSIGANECVLIGDPPPAVASGPPALNTTTTYTLSGRQIAGITWGSSGIVPSAIVFRYYAGIAPSGTGGAKINSNWINSHWKVDATGGASYSYSIKLFYRVEELNGIPEVNLQIAKRELGPPAQPWVMVGGIVDTTEKSVMASGLTGFSEFTLVNIILPVQISSFTGVSSGRQVRLNWATTSEVNNYGFYIQRKQLGVDYWTELTNSFVPGHGTTNEPQHYSYVDSNVTAGSWYYRLKQVDLDGSVHYSDAIQVIVVTGVKDVAPLEYALFQNYPNPFNPTTEIMFSVAQAAKATVEIYHILGQRVTTLFDDIAEPGQYYKRQFNGSNLSSGVYIYRMQSGGYTAVKKLLLLK